MAVQLQYAMKEEQIVHISEVQSGLKCGCVCPACNSPLIARKGSKTAHHFAHDKNPDCKKGIETALHLLSKEILSRYNHIKLPRVNVGFSSYKTPWIISPDRMFEYQDVKVEKRLNQIIPDVMILSNNRPLAIEITVTHPTDEPKLQRYREMGISVLEIDLSDFNRIFTIDELEKAVIEDTSRKYWLYNQKAHSLQQTALQFAETFHAIRRGFAIHIDYCPTNARIYKGKPYANLIDDCLSCPFCLEVDTSIDIVVCSGKERIDGYGDLLMKVEEQKSRNEGIGNA